MSSRFAISMLCVGAVAFACGPRTHNETSAPAKTGTATLAANTSEPTIAQQGARRRARNSEESLEAQLFVRTSESPIRFALHVVNTGKKRLELTFPSGQTHDFVILDTAGREVWRWGTGRMFTQTLRNKLLTGGESLELEEKLSRPALPPGRYTARAILTSQNYPLVHEAVFTISARTVAVR